MIMRGPMGVRPLAMRSALANRKMFRGGGMVPLGNPMANMQPRGILASSQPLVDAVASDILNPQGGATLSMADGGIAKFHEGGYVHDHPHWPTFGGLLPEPDPSEAGYTGPRTSIGLGSAPEAMQARTGMTSEELVGEILPEEASRVLGSTAPEIDFSGMSLAERAVPALLNDLNKIASWVSQGNQAAGKFIVDVFETSITDPVDRESWLKQLDQISSVNSMYLQKPRIEGVPDAEIDAEIKRIVETEVKANPYISGSDLEALVAQGLYDKYESGYAEAVLQRRTMGYEPPVTAAEDIAEAMPDTGEDTVIPDPDEPAPAPATDTDTAGAATVPAPDAVIEGDAPVRKEPPGIREVLPGPDELRYGQEIGELHGQLKLLEEIFAKADTPETEEDARKTLEGYIQEFKNAVPAYEGKTEFEQGMDIVKMAMAIGAGQSPNAIENISKGVLATIDNLTSDDKERRAYERQIGLSAAKYGLDSINADIARRDARLKEGREIPFELVAAEDFTDAQGIFHKAGTVFPATRDQIDAGILQAYPVTYKTVFVENARAVMAYERALADALNDRLKANTINRPEADAINERLSTAREDFIHAEGGEALLEGIITQLVTDPENIVGIEGATKKFVGDVMNFMGITDKPRDYTTRELLEVDMKIAFQKLIPVALRNIQAGNSISDRDVRNLANAFIAGGFISQNTDGTFTFNIELAGKNPKVMVRQLQETMKIFREAQESALVVFDQELYNLGQVAPGRYDIRYFEPELRRMDPALERYMEAQKGGLRGAESTAPTATAILNVSDYFNLETGELIQEIPRREGQL